MSKNGLTMTIVFVAESANYGEGFALEYDENDLKKLLKE